MLGEFRTFIARGNVVDLAVGIVIGAAFSTVVKSFVDDVLMPPVGLVMGGVDFSDLYVNLSGVEYASRMEAEAAGAPTIDYGVFLNNVLAFLITALAVFLLVKVYIRLREEEAEAPPPPSEKDCPFCRSRIHAEASRCAFCVADLSAAPVSTT